MILNTYSPGLTVAYLDEDDLNPEVHQGSWRDFLLNPGQIRGATNIRLEVPVDDQRHKELTSAGYVFADRMYDVSINLSRNKVDYAHYVRILSERTFGDRAEIKEIAHRSFTRDRRFHVSESLNQEIANQILDCWIDGLDNVFVCKIKSSVAGFLAVKELSGGDVAHIHLAAVDEKYRLGGVALSLYADVARQYRDKGYKSMKGYISSGNMAVMNLYVALGAIFTTAKDVFVKEVGQ